MCLLTSVFFCDVHQQPLHAVHTPAITVQSLKPFLQTIQQYASFSSRWKTTADANLKIFVQCDDSVICSDHGKLRAALT